VCAGLDFHLAEGGGGYREASADVAHLGVDDERPGSGRGIGGCCGQFEGTGSSRFGLSEAALLLLEARQ